jgi:uncharacterized protein (TIGR02996 family)
MNDETAFLRAMIANSGDETTRLVYADWLEERSDPRADFLRLDPELERLSYVAWLERDGHLDYYLQSSAEVREEFERRTVTQSLRNQRRALAASLDPGWVALIDSLACPFQPFFFFNNHGNPNEFRPDELPFAEQIGTRGAIVTFANDFREETCWDSGLTDDLRFLGQLELGECYYGAATCPLHPFICQHPPRERSLTGADVLGAVRAGNFRSRYIENLASTDIPFPGYHPGDGREIENDEIHNDFEGQHLFQNEGDEDGGEVDPFQGTHGDLKRYVRDGKLWYLLLHSTPEPLEEFRFSRYVVLFAIGQSPQGDRLLGVVSHQVCHNLCD